MAEDKRTNGIPISHWQLGIVMFALFFFVLLTLIISDSVYERPA